MKTKIIEVRYDKEVKLKFGDFHQFGIKVEIDGTPQWCQYLSKSKDQNKFVAGQEAEIALTSKEHNGKTYYSIKPAQNAFSGSNFSRKMKAEQSKYSGFAMSYAKDLVVSGSITPEQMFPTAKKMMDWMVEQDKNLENG
jgi:hypothetical protein